MTERERELFCMALGWMSAECCATLDNGGDPRKSEMPEMIHRALHDCGLEPETGEKT